MTLSSRAEVILAPQAAKLVSVLVTVHLVGLDPPCYDCEWFLRAEDGTYPDHGETKAITRLELIQTILSATQRCVELGARRVEVAVAVGTGVPRPISDGLVQKMVAGSVKAEDLLL